MNWQAGKIPSINTFASLFGQGKWTREEQLHICNEEIHYYHKPKTLLKNANILLTEAKLLNFFLDHRKLISR